MPLGVMIVLVAYTLDGVGPAPATWLPALAGIGTTTSLRLYFICLQVDILVFRI